MSSPRHVPPASYHVPPPSVTLLSHQCPGKTPIPYTEGQRDMSHFRVSPVPLEGRDKECPSRGVPVSHLTPPTPFRDRGGCPGHRSEGLSDDGSATDRKSPS